MRQNASTSWHEEDDDDSRTYATYSLTDRDATHSRRDTARSDRDAARSDDDDDDDDASIWSSSRQPAARPLGSASSRLRTQPAVHKAARATTPALAALQAHALRTSALETEPFTAPDPPVFTRTDETELFARPTPPVFVRTDEAELLAMSNPRALTRAGETEPFTAPAPAHADVDEGVLEFEQRATYFTAASPDDVLAAAQPPWAAPLGAADVRASVEYARAELADERALDADPVVRAAELVAGHARMRLDDMIEFAPHTVVERPVAPSEMSPTLAAYLGTSSAVPVDGRRAALIDAHTALRAPRSTGRYRLSVLFTTHTRAAARMLRAEYPSALGDVPLDVFIASDALIDAFALLAASSIGASGVQQRRRASDERVYLNRKREALAEFAHARYVPNAREASARLVYERAPVGRGVFAGDAGTYVSPEAAYGAALERHDPVAAARARLGAQLRALPGYEPVRAHLSARDRAAFFP